MPPIRLQEIRDKLEKKGYTSRLTAEDELLAELEKVSQLFDQNRITRKSANFSETLTVTSNPSGACSCCGR